MTKTAKQQAFVRAWVLRGDVVEAAAVAGISERTARRYSADPEVRRLVLAAQSEALRQAAQAACQASRQALDVLVDLASAPEVSPAVRVTAAKAILDTAGRLHEQAALAERLATLEELVEALDQRREPT
jgi:phage terminase small subunit